MVGDWDSLVQLVTDKGFFKTKYKSPIGFHPFVERIHEARGPPQLKSFFCGLVKDDEKRLDLALRFGVYDVLLETVTKLPKVRIAEDVKDQLLLARDYPPEDCPIMIDSALHDPSIKWK
eukprot:EC814083.1.p2 GENE.EC814083.1~~EC814083.1.p2  ORF type:complete len:119 (-),score=48.59 EC814083.1:262-618(-)